MSFLHPCLIIILLCSSLVTTNTLASPSLSRDVKQNAGLPDWVRFSVLHRTRYETLNSAFRKGTNGGDQVLTFRTQVSLEVLYKQFSIAAEMIDSRIALESIGTPVDNTMVNQTDLLQAYLAWKSESFFGTGLEARIKFGRQTIDLGSRRFVAKNRFRNTINNFTGFHFLLSNLGNWQWRNFVVLPVSRLPNDQISIRKGVVEFDEESFKILLAGSFFSIQHLAFDSIAELYFLHLNENDTKSTPTKNRNLSTPGFRWYREPKSSQFDFEFEAALQTGSSYASRLAVNTTKLNHFAYFGHIAMGYSFNLPWQPRVLIQYDYASGDSDPDDDKNERLETLYGARRFEFGPTSLWGTFSRANINTPGVRLQFMPKRSLNIFIAHRAFWLAKKRDTWVGSGLRDKSGRSGHYIGQQLEARFRWEAIKESINLEIGWAHLFKGQFAKNAPGSPENKNDSDYFYTQIILSF